MNISSFAAHSLPATRNDYSPNQICQPPFAKLIGNFSRTSCGRPLRRERAAALFFPFLSSSSFSFCPLLAFVNGVLLLVGWGGYRCPLFSRDNRVLVYISSLSVNKNRGLVRDSAYQRIHWILPGVSAVALLIVPSDMPQKRCQGGGRSGPLAWSDQVSGVTAFSEVNVNKADL